MGVVLSNSGVDTHVFRVSERLGLTKNAKNPLQAEKQLVKIFKKSEISKAHHWLILHGRYVCVARKPKCNSCGLNELCYFQFSIDNWKFLDVFPTTLNIQHKKTNWFIWVNDIFMFF